MEWIKDGSKAIKKGRGKWNKAFEVRDEWVWEERN